MKDRLQKYSDLYALTYKRDWLPMKVVIPFMRILERLSNRHMEENREFYSSQISDPERELKGVMVSLTSFPPRINDVWKTVLSLKRQSFRPEKIILWLSREEFPDGKIPLSLRHLEDDLFSIRMVEDNLMSHKKYYNVFNEYPDYTVITADDDIFYHRDMVKFLIECAERNPGCVVANRVNKIRWKKGKLKPYNDWQFRFRKIEKGELFQVGVDGVLYPPGILPAETFHKEIFMKLAPHADDVWLNAMTRLNRKEVVMTGFRYRNILTSPDSPKLEEINCFNGRNDIQIQAVREYLEKKHGIDLYAENYLNKMSPVVV